jgi:two-component system OmpR family response regulator
MRVLIIEDQEVMAVVLKESLRAHGHEPTAVDRLEAAEDALKCGSFDAHTVDNQLPDGKGVGFIRVLRERVGDVVPIVLVTADSGLDVINAAWDAGATAFVSKLSVNALDLVVEAVAGRRVWPEIDAFSLLSDDEFDAVMRLDEDAQLARSEEIAKDRRPPWSRA